MGAGAAEGLFR